MEIVVEWVPIEHSAYAAIWVCLNDQFTVFGTHTCMDGCEFHGPDGHMLTEWGFKGANAPLIRSICNGDREKSASWTYWIARVRGEGD